MKKNPLADSIQTELGVNLERHALGEPTNRQLIDMLTSEIMKANVDLCRPIAGTPPCVTFDANAMRELADVMDGYREDLQRRDRIRFTLDYYPQLLRPRSCAEAARRMRSFDV